MSVGQRFPIAVSSRARDAISLINQCELYSFLPKKRSYDRNIRSLAEKFGELKASLESQGQDLDTQEMYAITEAVLNQLKLFRASSTEVFIQRVFVLMQILFTITHSTSTRYFVNALIGVIFSCATGILPIDQRAVSFQLTEMENFFDIRSQLDIIKNNITELIYGRNHSDGVDHATSTATFRLKELSGDSSGSNSSANLLHLQYMRWLAVILPSSAHYAEAILWLATDWIQVWSLQNQKLVDSFVVEAMRYFLVWTKEAIRELSSAAVKHEISGELLKFMLSHPERKCQVSCEKLQKKMKRFLLKLDSLKTVVAELASIRVAAASSCLNDLSRTICETVKTLCSLCSSAEIADDPLVVSTETLQLAIYINVMEEFRVALLCQLRIEVSELVKQFHAALSSIRTVRLAFKTEFSASSVQYILFRRLNTLMGLLMLRTLSTNGVFQAIHSSSLELEIVGTCWDFACAEEDSLNMLLIMPPVVAIVVAVYVLPRMAFFPVGAIIERCFLILGDVAKCDILDWGNQYSNCRLSASSSTKDGDHLSKPFDENSREIVPRIWDCSERYLRRLLTGLHNKFVLQPFHLNDSQTSPNYCGWNVLSTDLIQYILSFLSFRRVCRIASVSKDLKAASSQGLLWKELYFRQFPHDRFESMVTATAAGSVEDVFNTPTKKRPRSLSSDGCFGSTGSPFFSSTVQRLDRRPYCKQCSKPSKQKSKPCQGSTECVHNWKWLFQNKAIVMKREKMKLLLSSSNKRPKFQDHFGCDDAVKGPVCADRGSVICPYVGCCVVVAFSRAQQHFNRHEK